MPEAKDDAIGGTRECKETEILVESEATSHKNGNESPVPGDDNSCLLPLSDVVEDNSYLPPLSNDVARRILSKLPRSNYSNLRRVSPQLHSLIKNNELINIRKETGIKEPKVFFFSIGAEYYCYEPYARSCWNLPVCPYDKTIKYSYKKSLSVKTHLFMLGLIKTDIEFSNHLDIWRYELELNQWFNDPMMITPRFYFASADCGSVVCVAGGKQLDNEVVLNSAEKYNPEGKSWEPLPSMINQRSYCSGIYMDNKFYVIGGRNEDEKVLTCGESYDFELNEWKVIPNMIPFKTLNLYQLTDFMVVVNNELYCLEFPSRHLKVYLKNDNVWKKVGSVPPELKEEPEVILKSLGDELLLIGKMQCNTIVLCFCTPNPELDNVDWEFLEFNNEERNATIYDCNVMMANLTIKAERDN